MTEYFLYTRPGCHLCDEALELCRECGLEPEPVDISGDLALLEAYGRRIPVLRRADSGDELGWPFSAGDIRSLAGGA